MGITLSINTYIPQEVKLGYKDDYLNLAPNTSEWNPRDDTYVMKEEATLSLDGNIKQPRQDLYIFSVQQQVLDQDKDLNICSQVLTVLVSVSMTLHPKSFLDNLMYRVDTEFFGHVVSAFDSTRRCSTLVQELIEVWNIGKEGAPNTLRTTMQLIVRSAAESSLSKRYY